MFPNIPIRPSLLPDIGEAPTDLSEPPFHPDKLDNRNLKVIELALDINESAIIPYHRAEIEGAENIPEGAAMYVGNHNGGLLSIDTFIASCGMCRQGGLDALPYAMCHDLVIDNPSSTPSSPLSEVFGHAEKTQAESLHLNIRHSYTPVKM